MRFSTGIVLVTLILSGSAFAATRNLYLCVTGTILPRPDWETADGPSWEKDVDFSVDRSSEKAPVTNVCYDFGGVVAGDTPALNVDSAAIRIRLTNATSYPATVALTRPTGCMIGVSPIHGANVHFINNGIAVTTNSNISMTSNALQSYGLRFAAAGNHGSQYGAVTCTSAGSLTYTY